MKKIWFLILFLFFFLYGNSYALDITQWVYTSSYVSDVGIHDLHKNGNNMYLLTSAWYIKRYNVNDNLSSVTYVSEYNLGFTSVSWFFINNSWSKIYVLYYTYWGSNSYTSYVRQYNLSVAWDVTTMSYIWSYTLCGTGWWCYPVQDISIRGDNMYISRGSVSSGGVYIFRQYTIVNGDVSTISYVREKISSITTWYEGEFRWWFYLTQDNKNFISLNKIGNLGSFSNHTITWGDITTLSYVNTLGASGGQQWVVTMDGNYLYSVNYPTGSTISVYYSSTWEEVPPLDTTGMNCYEQLMNSWYSFLNKSIYWKNQSNYTLNTYVAFSGSTGQFSTSYIENSTQENHVYAGYSWKEANGSTSTGLFTSNTLLELKSSPYPWDYTRPYINISRHGWIDYIKLVGSWAEAEHNTFQIWIFASNSINAVGEADYLLGNGKFFNFNEEISLKNYTDDHIYAIVFLFDKFGWFQNMFGTTYYIDWIEYGTYSINSTIHEICIDPDDGTVYRDWVVYTGSLDVNGNLPELPTVGENLPEYTGTWWLIEGANDIIGEFFGWIASIKNAGNNLIELVKKILQIWQTDEVRDWSWFLFIWKANASFTPSTIISGHIDDFDNNVYSWVFYFLLRGVLFVILVLAILTIIS